ncbi:lysylphosphatidylglycerol synthase domain-containing protein [Streptomyces sp. NPDC093252]|uniref:lysylphosphatidylglycerol synthase transmembrane domain-containing protein n=1 Tax=Streptomyces sp. NPDC093252 TaxID=3154980 RepID=UPI0034229C73
MTLMPLDGLPQPAAPAVDPAPLGPPAPTGPRSPAAARAVRLTISLLPLLLIAGWAVVDRRSLYDGVARLASADPAWLLIAGVLTALGWVAAACVRQGAVPERLPPGLLLASQFAAGAANHVLPASIGAHAVTLRFLQRQGIPLARGTASLALYSLVKPVAKTAVLLVFLIAFPDMLHFGDLLPDTSTVVLIAGGIAAALAATVVLLAAVPSLRRPVTGFLGTALTDARVLHTRPSRYLPLWLGAAATPLLQGSVIAAVGFALGLPLSWAQVVFALLIASTAVGAVPAPGGIGPLDAAMVFTMTAFGAPVGLATATIIGYRVLTVWIPLLPGALVLSALVQRKAL